MIEEEKTVLMEVVWAPHEFEFVENLKQEIDMRTIDYIIANHGEYDHSGSLEAVLRILLFCTANAVKSIEGQ